MILPLVSIHMNRKVKEFIVSNAIFVLSVYSLPIQDVKEMPLIKDLSFDQPDEYLRILGWTSGSSLVNNLLLLFELIGILILHLICMYLNKRVKNRDDCFKFLVSKVYGFFNFTIYIWIFIDIYMLSFVMFFSEIKYYIKNGGDQDFGHGQEGQYEEPRGNYVSLSITCVLLVLPILFFILVCISWNYVKDIVKIESTYEMSHLYSGILEVPKQLLSQQTQNNQDENQDENQDKNQTEETESNVPKQIKIARLYSLLYLIKSFVTAFIVVLLPSSIYEFKI